MDKTIIIIIPVYNVEKYLCRCIDSILRQTYINFKLILINDGSTDKSGEICEKYKFIDSRIEVYHKINEGVSSARNLGIEIALKTNSSWMTFIDSDDWVHEQYLEMLLKACECKNTDVSMCGYLEVVDEVSYKKIDKFTIYEFSAEKTLIYKNKYVDAFAWGHLYNIELFRTRRFPIGMKMEDYYLIPEIIIECKKVAVIKDNLYYYFKNENSILHNKDLNLYLDAVNAIEHQIQIFEKNKFYNLAKIQAITYVKILYSVFLCLYKKENIQEDNIKIYTIIRRARNIVKKYFFSLDYKNKITIIVLLELYIPYKIIYFFMKYREKYKIVNN